MLTLIHPPDLNVMRLVSVVIYVRLQNVRILMFTIYGGGYTCV